MKHESARKRGSLFPFSLYSYFFFFLPFIFFIFIFFLYLFFLFIYSLPSPMTLFSIVQSLFVALSSLQSLPFSTSSSRSISLYMLADHSPLHPHCHIRISTCIYIFVSAQLMPVYQTGPRV